MTTIRFHRTNAAILAMASLLMLSACTSMKVSSDFDASADFDSYSQFHVLPSRSIDDADINQLVGEMISVELGRKGLHAVTNGADLIVTYDGWVGGREQIASRLGYAVETYNGETTVYTVSRGVSVGTLVVSLIDASDGEIVWQAEIQAGLEHDRPPEERVKRLEQAISKLFASYPPQP
jgi:hypothetical protein